MSRRLINNLFFLLILTVIPDVSAQFYNGSQMTFGKNRVQYNDFYWSFLRYDRFDTYYSEYGKPIAEYTAKYAEKELTPDVIIRLTCD